MPRPRVTERTFYNSLMETIRSKGGQSVQEVIYNTTPDIQFELGDRSWILSVKIGENAKIIKDAFLQYLRHKEESQIPFGILLLLPESMRKVLASEEAIRLAMRKTAVTALIDADLVKEELRDRPFSGVIDFLIQEVLMSLARRQPKYYSLNLVISLLQQQVAEVMQEINLDEPTILHIITDRNLLMDLGHLESNETEAIARFLASYIFLSQLIFLRLLITARPGFLSVKPPVSHSMLRHAFSKVLDINYRPIYDFDVLDSINEEFLADTFDLIWGLEIERVRHELPGRIFHELMPKQIRKMLAAFYTRPQAADLLANITISRSEENILDLACGSGTILTSSYRRKLELFKEEGKIGNPHKRFCEQEIIGSDIMPFAVHLTSANLSAMNPAVTIEKTQVIQGDSLRMEPKSYPAGMQMRLFPESAKARTIKGDVYKVQLKPVDVVLMNPPFTKVERGIRNFVDMKRFSSICGGEVGLWGHFIILTDIFLKEKGSFGAVLPINVLRGRESARIRRMLFEKWTPLYILKPTRNYGFSEWSEYRDVLFVASKQNPSPDHKVKFCLVKRDLTKLSETDITMITDKVKTHTKLRNDYLVDVDSHKLSEVHNRFKNLMWFCGVTDFSRRDIIVNFINQFSGKLSRFPSDYLREGYRPVPKGVSKFLFLTRHSHDTRVQQAFLRFTNERKSFIMVQSPLRASYEIERDNILPTLRTSVGLQAMDITNTWDYIACSPYKEIKRVCRASNQLQPKQKFWDDIQSELQAVETNIVVSHRINPFSPATHLNSFFSHVPISPSNQLNVIKESNIDIAQAICILLNSVIFFAQFFLLKEESTGRYINIRFYDLEEMKLYPANGMIQKLVNIFQQYHHTRFPSLREQFDKNFDERYKEFWEKERGSRQQRLWSVIRKPVEPFLSRLNFDLAVCQAIGIPIKKSDLIRIYEVFVNEMIIIRGLTKD